MLITSFLELFLGDIENLAVVTGYSSIFEAAFDCSSSKLYASK